MRDRLEQLLRFKFKMNKDFVPKAKEKCFLCNGLFDSLNEYSKKAVKKLKGIEFNNFSVGSVIPNEVLKERKSSGR